MKLYNNAPNIIDICMYRYTSKYIYSVAQFNKYILETIKTRCYYQTLVDMFVFCKCIKSF